MKVLSTTGPYGLVLGAGTVGGIAELGVLQYLSEKISLLDSSLVVLEGRYMGLCGIISRTGKKHSR